MIFNSTANQKSQNKTYGVLTLFLLQIIIIENLVVGLKIFNFFQDNLFQNLLYFLDYKRSEEAIDFTDVFFFLGFFYV